MMEKYFFTYQLMLQIRCTMPHILSLMKEVIDSVGEQYVVQVITDNRPQYKTIGELLMEQQP